MKLVIGQVVKFQNWNGEILTGTVWDMDSDPKCAVEVRVGEDTFMVFSDQFVN